MKLKRCLTTLLVSLASVNLVFPLHALAADSAATRIQDIALGDGGQIRGQVLDSEGQASRGSDVFAVQGARLVSRAKTDASGRFALNGLKGGVFQIATANSLRTVRCWAPSTAPPSAQRELLLVDDGTTVRGQHPVASLLTNPFFIGLLIAAAIAIPIIVNENKKDAS